MGKRSGVEAVGVALAALVFIGCQSPKRRAACTTDYYYDEARMELVPVDPDCLGNSNGGGHDDTIACTGLASEFDRVVELSSGLTRLVDIFVSDGGIIVVTQPAVELFDRRGGRLARWTEKNLEIDSAAFDGSTLAISSASELISFDVGLNEIARGSLAVRCDSSVLVGGGRFVCGEFAFDGRTYHTYDALTGQLVSSTTGPEFENGLMRRVPGRDAFLSASAGVPRNFELFEVEPTGSIRMTATTRGRLEPFRMSPVYGFVGNPATRVITDQGLLLCATPEDCAGESLKPVGDIGLLPDELFFGAIDGDNNQGKVHTIVGPKAGIHLEALECENGCAFERIDIASRAVEGSVPFALAPSMILAMLRADPQGGILFGCADLAAVGHRVMLLPDAP